MLWPIELDAMILSWPDSTLPAPGGEDELRLSKSVQERIIVAETVRAICKRIPDQQRRKYLAQLRSSAPLKTSVLDSNLVGFMSWDDARDLLQRGFAFGSDSIDHPVLTTISPEELERQLRGSKAVIEEELRTPCCFITYPNGGRQDFSAEVIRAAQKAG